MKTQKLLILFLAAILGFTSCRKTDDDEVINPPKAPETINGEITANKTLTADRVWYLDGVVLVKNNATLTVEAGTVVRAKIGTKAALVIDKGAKLIADGTVTKPIVFTSGKDAGSRTPGDWGGIILVGKAPTNRTTPVQVEGGVALTYGTDNVPADNSGTLRYVRIEYAGIGVNDSEINALTFYAVGSGTVVENVQTIYANDDAYEFFGGTVNCKNLIAFATADDDFDFDFGFNGSIQFGLSLRDPKFVDAADDGNGIECDNDKDGTDAAPITQPKLSNLTLIGPNNAAQTASRHAYGNRWRRGAKFIFNNSIVLGHQKGGLNIESDKSANFYKNGDSQFKNNIVASFATPFLVTAATLTVAEIQTKALADGNLIVTDVNTSVKLNNPFSLTGPNFLPGAGSPALTGTFAATPNATAVTYRGAFGATDWTAGWANWDAQNTKY